MILKIKQLESPIRNRDSFESHHKRILEDIFKDNSWIENTSKENLEKLRSKIKEIHAHIPLCYAPYPSKQKFHSEMLDSYISRVDNVLQEKKEEDKRKQRFHLQRRDFAFMVMGYLILRAMELLSLPFINK